MAFMSLREPSFTVGVEEEYLLVDIETRDLVSDPPPDLMEKCEAALPKGQVSPEFLKSQIEVGTPVCATIPDVRKELRYLRKTIAEVASEYGLAPMAASTHPFAKWTAQHQTDKDRYHEIANDLQVVVRRMIICGMHVHVGLDDDELRIDILNQASYFLPHLLALSTSSPFWQGEETGLRSYRLSVFDELPRTGLPPQFVSYSEYERTIAVLVNVNAIEDATKIWWDLRPSHNYPTLEMRITDVCPLLEDTLCIAAFFQCICRLLYRLRRKNQRWRFYPPFLINENRWRAQRYGLSEGLIDFGEGKVVSCAKLMEELLEMIAEDADALGCVEEVQHVKRVLKRGTSAERQVKCFEDARAGGKSDEDALKAVVDELLRETLADT
jgi:carboxylate-amine ligase